MPTFKKGFKLPPAREMADFIKSGVSTVAELARAYNVSEVIIRTRLHDAGYTTLGERIIYTERRRSNLGKGGGPAGYVGGGDNPTVVPIKPVCYRPPRAKPRGFDWGDLPAPRRSRRRDLMGSRVFRAAYTDKCGECGDDITEGDAVQYVDHQLVHEDCNPEIMTDC